MMSGSLNVISANVITAKFIRFLLASCILFCGWCISAQPVRAETTKPNIVILYADDLGYGDVQCYNPERGKIPTPHIDRLATQGMRFTDAHSSSGVCSPSRYTLLTGRYHWRSRLQGGIVGLWERPLIAADRMTIGTLAKQQGYKTACIGKWHLGWDWPIPQAEAALFKQTPKGDAAPEPKQLAVWKEVFTQPIAGGPITRGFDTYFGTDVPNWPPYCFIENDRTVGIPDHFLPGQLIGNNLASKQGPAIENWSLENILPTLGNRAVKFINEQAARKEPFLLYLPFTSPHTPLAVGDSWKGKSGLGRFGDLVMETDAVVGQVLAALDEKNLTKDTLVIFTSDNGCAPYIGVKEMEKAGHYPSGPLRGYKSDVWEGGHRVPFIVRWPAVVKPGSVSNQLVHQADLMATFADVLGAKLPEDVGEDSFSLLPLLKGSDKPVREDAVSCGIGGMPAFRVGSWKLILGPGSGGWSPGKEDGAVQLYDLSSDMGESKNLASAELQRVAKMREQFESVIQQGRSNEGPPQKNDVTVKRFAAENDTPKTKGKKSK